MVAAAVVAGAVVGAAGTAYAGSQAAGATKDASNAAINEQKSALQQQAQLSAPYRALGESAVPTLQSLLGIAGPSGASGGGGKGGSGMSTIQPLGGGPTGSGFDRMGGAHIPSAPGVPGGNSSTGSAGSITDTLRNMPGYQFIQEQGTEGAMNQASAMGMGLSGNTLEGLSKFNQGLADNQYQQFLGDIMNVTQIGQAAAAGQAANIGNAANNISSNLINQGNTLAGINTNEIAGITKSIGNGANQYMMMNTLNGLNNPNNNPSNWDTENTSNFQDFTSGP